MLHESDGERGRHRHCSQNESRFAFFPSLPSLCLKGFADFELVDVSDRMPDLVRRPGMTTWKVANQQLEVFDSFEQYSELTKNKSRTKGAPLTVGHFPPEPQDAEALHLER